MTETRAVAESGGMKGRKASELSDIDPKALLALGRASRMGADKYGAGNYRRGYPWSWSYDACQRHLMAFWDGEDVDPESGESHLAHAAWHALAMLSFTMEHPEYDNRRGWEDLDGENA